MTEMRCKRCLTPVSVFWTPFTIGDNPDLMDAQVFWLCDDCVHEFAMFLKGHVINEMVIRKARPNPKVIE